MRVDAPAPPNKRNKGSPDSQIDLDSTAIHDVKPEVLRKSKVLQKFLIQEEGPDGKPTTFVYLAVFFVAEGGMGRGF